MWVEEDKPWTEKPMLKPGSTITLNWIPESEWIVWAANQVEFFVFNPSNGEFLCVRMEPKVYTLLDKPIIELKEAFNVLQKGVERGVFINAMHGKGKLQELAREKWRERERAKMYGGKLLG